jgi:hypothetical protein
MPLAQSSAAPRFFPGSESRGLEQRLMYMGVTEDKHVRQRRHGEANQPFINDTVEMLMYVTRL